MSECSVNRISFFSSPENLYTRSNRCFFNSMVNGKCTMLLSTFWKKKIKKKIVLSVYDVDSIYDVFLAEKVRQPLLPTSNEFILYFKNGLLFSGMEYFSTIWNIIPRNERLFLKMEYNFWEWNIILESVF